MARLQFGAGGVDSSQAVRNNYAADDGSVAATAAAVSSLVIATSLALPVTMTLSATLWVRSR
jgi:hypothetical protein